MSQRTVFTVMPFSDRSKNVWESGICAACKALGWRCLRADMINAPGFVVPQVYDSINSADLVIGEMSDRNPNVFYEIGFAHALGKPTVLLAASSDDLKAFDTQGFRHFLHSGDATRARDILLRVLPEIDESISVQPAIPNGITLYEWPHDSYEAPRFAWHCAEDPAYLQIDLDGGQRLIETVGLGRLISISNTLEFWNHHPGFSVMTLMVARDLEPGDSVVLIIDGRSSGTGTLGFIGDGGWVEGPRGRKWAQSWVGEYRPVHPTTAWTRWVFANVVAPNPAEYDL